MRDMVGASAAIVVMMRIMMDGPFVETKELIAGDVTVSAESLNDANQFATRYIDVVEADEVDVRELE